MGVHVSIPEKHQTSTLTNTNPPPTDNKPKQTPVKRQGKRTRKRKRQRPIKDWKMLGNNRHKLIEINRKYTENILLHKLIVILLTYQKRFN